MISPEALSTLIGEIYDCVLDPGGWERTIGNIRAAANCMNAILAVQSFPSGRILLAVTSDITPADLVRMNQYGPDIIEQWGGAGSIARRSFEEPAVLSWERPRALWEDNRYYREWAKPQGIIDVIGLVAARDADTIGTLGFARHVSAGPVTEDDVETLRLLVPHVQRAVSITRLLDLEAVAARSFQAALDVVATGVVLVADGLRIVHANQAAAEMLRAGDPIARADGALVLPRGALAQQALADAVAQAMTDEASIGRRGFGIPARFADGKPAVLHVLPLTQGKLRGGLSPSAVAAIFIAPGTEPHPAPERALAALFDLTPSETRVFSLLGAGKTLAETAKTLGIERSTARTHLLRIFAKTGVSRQPELVRLAASLAMAV